MVSKSDLINMLAQAIVANPANRLHRGTEEVIAGRLSEALTDLGGKPVFKTARGYLYSEDGCSHGGIAEFVADLRQDGAYLFTDEGSGDGAAIDPSRRAQAAQDENAGLHPSYVAWKARQAQGGPEAAPEPKDKGLNFM